MSKELKQNTAAALGTAAELNKTSSKRGIIAPKEFLRQIDSELRQESLKRME